MFAILIPILAQFGGLIGEYFKQKNEILTATNEAARQVELAKAEMAREIAAAQLNLNATIVQSTSSAFKYFTFVMWYGPYMIGLVSPSMSKAIFDNMLGMPEWYVQSCIIIMFTVWGISVSANVINGVFSGIGEFFKSRREYKLEMVTVKSLNESKFFDSIRKSLGSISPATFEQLKKALEAGKQ